MVKIPKEPALRRVEVVLDFDEEIKRKFAEAE
jgi:hypothetical protein